MIDGIPVETEPFNTWLVDSFGNIAVSGAGLEILEADMTPLHGTATDEFDPANT